MWPDRISPKQCPVGEMTLPYLGGRNSRPLNWTEWIMVNPVAQHVDMV